VRQGPPRIPRPIWQANDKNMFKPDHVQLISHKIFKWFVCLMLVVGLVSLFSFLLDFVF